MLDRTLLRLPPPPARRRPSPLHRPAGLALALLGACGCSGPSAAGTASHATPPAANVLEPGRAPTPFSAAEIRESCRGRELEQEFVVDGGTKRRVTKFGRGTDETAELEVREFGADGKPLGEPLSGSTSWADLQKHASFPAHRTEITSETRTTPAGTFECWRYDVHGGPDGNNAVRRFWFAKRLAGPPVHMEAEVNGRTTTTMTLLARR